MISFPIATRQKHLILRHGCVLYQLSKLFISKLSLDFYFYLRDVIQNILTQGKLKG